MILYPYFELVASLFILLFGFHLHLRHHENRVARFFIRFTMVTFFAAILTYSCRIAFTLPLAENINRFAAAFTLLAFSVFAHFALIFTHHSRFLRHRYPLVLLYLPPLFLSGLLFVPHLIYARFDILSYGIIGQPAWWHLLFSFSGAFYLFWGTFLLLRYSKQSPQITERKQAFLIAWGSFMPLSVGIIVDQLLPLFFGYPPLPPVIVFSFAVMNFCIYLAMRRYSLFSISPCLAAQSIIETMPDSLLVTDIEGRVLFLNDEAHKFFHAAKEVIIGKNIQSLFTDQGQYLRLYDEVVNKGIKIERFEANLCDPLGECIPSFVNATVFHDELGALLGIIFIIRDIRG